MYTFYFVRDKTIKDIKAHDLKRSKRNMEAVWPRKPSSSCLDACSGVPALFGLVLQFYGLVLESMNRGADAVL